MLNKHSFNTIFSLTLKQPWLIDKISEVESLLIKECINDDEQGLVLDLLNRFKYLTNDTFHKALEDIVEKIVSNERYSVDNTIIAATTLGPLPDSGQYVLYEMKPIFQKYNWDKPNLVNSAEKIIETFPQYHNVIFVDEFIGSGKTMLRRISKLKRELLENDFNEFSMKIFAVASSTIGENILREAEVELESILFIPRGISDHFEIEEQKEEKLSLMMRLEELLSREYDGHAMPSLGYGQVEALYARERGNTPNNVFPLFWWKFYLNGERRPTILIRSMGDA